MFIFQHVYCNILIENYLLVCRMSKRMSREQEKAMFAKQGEGKSYSRTHDTTADELYAHYKKEDLLDDRREYDVDDLQSANPGLSRAEAVKLHTMLAVEHDNFKSGYDHQNIKTTQRTYTVEWNSKEPDLEYVHFDSAKSEYHKRLPENTAIVKVSKKQYFDIADSLKELPPSIRGKVGVEKPFIITDGTNALAIDCSGYKYPRYKSPLYTPEAQEVLPYNRKQERLNSPPVKPRPTKVTGEAKFSNGRLMTPKPAFKEKHSQTTKTKRERSTKKQRATIEPTGKGDTKEYRVTVNDELLSTSFTSKKKAKRYARSQGYSVSK